MLYLLPYHLTCITFCCMIEHDMDFCRFCTKMTVAFNSVKLAKSSTHAPCTRRLSVLASALNRANPAPSVTRCNTRTTWNYITAHVASLHGTLSHLKMTDIDGDHVSHLLISDIYIISSCNCTYVKCYEKIN